MPSWTTRYFRSPGPPEPWSRPGGSDILAPRGCQRSLRRDPSPAHKSGPRRLTAIWPRQHGQTPKLVAARHIGHRGGLIHPRLSGCAVNGRNVGTQRYRERVLESFHPAVRAWFEGRFPAGPTEPQAAGWREIAAGRHTLIAAPTGSGKTLAAFLVCIDRFYRAHDLNCPHDLYCGHEAGQAPDAPAGATPDDITRGNHGD